MKKKIELSLQEELKREAEEIKEKIEQRPELAQLTVSEDADARFFERAIRLEKHLEAQRELSEEWEREDEEYEKQLRRLRMTKE